MVAAFKAASPRLTFRVRQESAQAAVDEVAADDLDALIAARLPSDLTRTPSLRWMQVLSAGVENLVGPGATRAWPAGIDADQRARRLRRRRSPSTRSRRSCASPSRSMRRNAQQRLGAWPADQGALGGRRSADRRWSSSATAGSVGRSPASRRPSGCGSSPSRPTRRSTPTTGSGSPGTGDPDGSIPERIVGLDGPSRRWPPRPTSCRSRCRLTNGSAGVVSRAVLEALPGHAWLDQHRPRTGRRRGRAREVAGGRPDRWRRARRVRRGAAAAASARSGTAERRHHAACLGLVGGEERSGARDGEPPPVRRRRAAPQSRADPNEGTEGCRPQRIRAAPSSRSRSSS